VNRPPVGAPAAPAGWWLIGLALVAANLRPVISSVPPLADQLVAEFGLSATQVGALTTLPVVCMGLFAPAAALLARRHGESTVLAAAVAVIGIGAATRALAGTAGLYSGAILAGVGIAIAGTLLPSLVRTRFPGRVGPVTGLYTAALIAGAFLAAGATEPLRAAFGLSPQVTLALWALPAGVALVAWLLVPRVGRTQAPTRVTFPWRSTAAWLGTLFMGGQSLLFYATLAWLAPTYTRLGHTASYAGLLLAVFSAAQIVTALAMPALAHRGGDVRPWIALSVGATVVGLEMVAFAPEGILGAAAPWIWAILLGLGMGGNLALALLVLTQNAPTPQAAAAFTGMAFFVGYLMAAAGPVAAGALRDVTGSYAPVFAVLSVLGVLTLAVGGGAAYPSATAHPSSAPHPSVSTRPSAAAHPSAAAPSRRLTVRGARPDFGRSTRPDPPDPTRSP
jgi:CP family cyanate transporter-like MFS transporter